MSETGSAETEMHGLSDLISLVRCLECRGPVELVEVCIPGVYPELGPDGRLRCTRCGVGYPVIGGTARMLRPGLQRELPRMYPRAAAALADVLSPLPDWDTDLAVKQRTAESFAYEWQRFGQERPEWRKNFLDYMRPHRTDSFNGRLVLDVGAGSGRHSIQADRLGAQVVAVDIGSAIDVARRKLPARALTVQADAEDLPFEHEAFDFVMAVGVLHHLPDPERAFHAIVPYARPGGWIQIYVYWWPPRYWHRRVLRLVSRFRRITTRMPYRVLHGLSYPLAAALYLTCVLPYRALRTRRRTRVLADLFPLKTYADYPFGVCVNDQFDRFSAPLERRFDWHEIDAWLRCAGLEDRQVLANHGWLGSGRRPRAPERVTAP